MTWPTTTCRTEVTFAFYIAAHIFKSFAVFFIFSPIYIYMLRKLPFNQVNETAIVSCEAELCNHSVWCVSNKIAWNYRLAGEMVQHSTTLGKCGILTTCLFAWSGTSLNIKLQDLNSFHRD